MESGICEVNSQVALMLRLARAVGLAPVQLSPAPRGYRVTVSRGYNIYGCILWTITSIVMCCGFAYDMFTPEIGGEYRVRNIASKVTGTIELLLTHYALILAAYGGLKRMRRFMFYINNIKNINTDMNNNYINIRLKKSGVIIWSVNFLLIYVFQAFSLYKISKVFKKNNKDVYTLPFRELDYIIISFIALLQMYLMLILSIVHGTVCVFNERLRCLISKGSLKVYTLTADRNATRQVYRTYVSLCELVTKINDEEGALVLSLLLANIISIISSIYLLTSMGSSIDEFTTEVTITMGVLFLRIINKSFRLILLIELYHRIQIELQEVNPLLSQLIRNTRGEQSKDLNNFFYHTAFDIPTFWSLGVFHLTRAFHFTVLSAITTFLLIISQFNIKDIVHINT